LRHLSTGDKECSGRSTQVTFPENMDVIHSMIPDDRRISSNKIAEILGISQEREGYIINEILDMRRLSAKWIHKCLNAVRSMISACLTSHFRPISAGSSAIFEPSSNYG
jgi:hypothetical protein